MTTMLKGKAARLLFLFGSVLIFVSLFLDLYYYSASMSGMLVVDWTYNGFLGWRTSFIKGIASNEALRPGDNSEVMVMSIILIVLTIICAYGTMIKDVEKTNSTEKSRPYVYLNVFLMLIVGYFIVVMPFTFIFSNKLYFPFMTIKDLETGITHFYCIGPGYVLQVLSFLIMFPHVLFSLFTLARFESEKRSPEALIKKTLEESHEEIPLEKFIAELKSEAKSKENASVVYEQFQRQRRRRI